MKINKELIFQFAFTVAAGIFAIYLWKAGIPGKISAAIGDNEQDETSPIPAAPATDVVNEVPGANQTYNLPNQPVVTQPASDADYLSQDQVNAALAPQAQSTIQNVLSVGADYSEFVPAPGAESLPG